VRHASPTDQDLTKCQVCRSRHSIDQHLPMITAVTNDPFPLILSLLSGTTSRIEFALPYSPIVVSALANPRTSTTRSRSDGGQKRARRQTAGHAIVVFLETLPRSSDPSLSFGMQLGVETMPKAPNRPPSVPNFRFSHWPLRVAS